MSQLAELLIERIEALGAENLRRRLDRTPVAVDAGG
jgi:hypothetical protein